MKSEATNYITTHTSFSNLFVRHHPVVLCGTALNSFSKRQMHYLFSISDYEFNSLQR